MDRNELIQYWIKSSDEDSTAVEHLFQSGDYSWALFIAHLTVEKLLKAYYVITVDENVPFTHNLIAISKKTTIDLTDDKMTLLSDITSFNIAARYEDYKESFRKKCTKEFTEMYLIKIREINLWIKSLIKKHQI